MNEVFAAIGMETLINGITLIVVALVSVCCVFTAYRFVKKALLGGSHGYDDDPDFSKGQSMIDDAKERECKRIYGKNYKGI